MKRLKRISILLSFILTLSSFTFFVSAEQESSSIYEETREQVSMKNLELENDGEKLTVNVADCNFISKAFAKSRKEKLEDFFVRNPHIEQYVTENVDENNELCAISTTTAPIYLDEDGEWKRVEKERKQPLLLRIASLFTIKANAIDIQTDEKYGGDKGNFKLSIIVTRPNDDYVVTTIGNWETGSWVGGENYPASGLDYVSQSAPLSTSIYENDLLACYTKTGDNEYKDEYIHDLNTKESYVQQTEKLTSEDSKGIMYSIKDDPFGMDRLYGFILQSSYHEIENTKYKVFDSEYCHTWADIECHLDIVHIPAKPGVDARFGIQICPMIVALNWKVYSYVSVDF